VPASEPRTGRAGRVPGHRRLSLSYLFEGIGYIIIGTYLVALVAESTGAQDATWVWVVAGLAAVPSPVLWAAVSRRVGLTTALTGAYVLQILAAVLPVAVGGVAGGYLGAALFGATFMGITQMTMARARQLGIGAAAAGLTLVYALGQLLGPLIVAVLPAGGYGPAFLVAAVILGGATVLTVTGRN
jgi:MFS family permease